MTFSTQAYSNSKSKSILFISALDFKEKSIQVIKKTPEAYVKAGWNVYYVVARDNSKYGNYFYEKEINPEGVKVYRFYMPLTGLVDKIKHHTIRTIISKIRGYITILKLVVYASKVLKINKIDVIYGYEIHGVLAVNLLKLFGKLKKNVKIISRFQGTFLANIIKEKKYFKAMLNWEHLLALWLPSDLCIMTNDGTQGDYVLKKIKSRNLRNLKFWINGVDEQKLPIEAVEKLKKELNIKEGTKIILSVCRLVSWKRVERGIFVINKLVKGYGLNNIIYFIVGDGSERQNLENLVKKLDIKNYVRFTGAIRNEEVKKYLNIADIFISTYDVTNVGNPLLEAIRANKIIFTLNNGDTGKWITHRVNGFIYDIDDNLEDRIAADIYEVLNNEKLRKKIEENIKITEREKLWTWEERFNAEIKEVERLFDNEIEV